MFNNCTDHFMTTQVIKLVKPETELVLDYLDEGMFVKVFTVESEELMTWATKYE